MEFRISLLMVCSQTTNSNLVDQAEVGGAQEPGVFKQIFEQLEKFKPANLKAKGDACLPDGSNC